MTFTTYIDMGELGDQEVEVSYDYRAGWKGSWNEPPEYPEVEITAVTWRGMDIHSLLSKDSIERFVEDGFDDVASLADQAQEDAAEARYFDREEA